MSNKFDTEINKAATSMLSPQKLLDVRINKAVISSRQMTTQLYEYSA